MELAKEDFYSGVGKSVVNKFYWVVGVIVVGALAWLNSKGFIKL